MASSGKVHKRMHGTRGSARRGARVALSVACLYAVAQPVAAAGPAGPLPLVAQATARWAVNLRQAPNVTATMLALLPPGTALALDAWATDDTGTAWYHGVTASGAGWVYGDALTFATSPAADPAALLVPFRGTGLWLTYDVLQHTPVGTIIRTAQQAGVSHLYVEVAASGVGFYGARGLAALLPAAHRAGLRVLTWVYSYLLDLPHDIDFSVAAATYVAPSGDRPDGLLADVEENMAEDAVRAYGQILRAKLGPNEPLALATYPPQAPKGQAYPFATAALSWNVIVPMDYWHLSDRSYSSAEVYQFVSQSVRLVRARTSPSQAVAVIGQLFAPDPAGTAPTTDELLACAQAAQNAGAIGVSFYDWSHATPADWRLLGTLPGAVVPPSGQPAPVVQITVPLLNLRAGPSLTAPIIAQLTRGTRLRVRSYQDAWVAVIAPDGSSGYVYAAGVRAVSAPAPSYLVVQVPLAHLRAGPSLQSTIVASLAQGTRVAVQGVQDGWAKVAVPGGAMGWIWRALTQKAG